MKREVPVGPILFVLSLVFLVILALVGFVDWVAPQLLGLTPGWFETQTWIRYPTIGSLLIILFSLVDGRER